MWSHLFIFSFVTLAFACPHFELLSLLPHPRGTGPSRNVRLGRADRNRLPWVQCPKPVGVGQALVSLPWGAWGELAAELDLPPCHATTQPSAHPSGPGQKPPQETQAESPSAAQLPRLPTLPNQPGQGPKVSPAQHSILSRGLVSTGRDLKSELCLIPYLAGQAESPIAAQLPSATPCATKPSKMEQAECLKRWRWGASPAVEVGRPVLFPKPHSSVCSLPKASSENSRPLKVTAGCSQQTHPPD